MVALYRSGRQADALAVYERLRACLRDELGLDPTPQLRTLEHDILNHAPTLTSGSHVRVALRSEDHEPPRAAEMQRWFDQLGVPALDDKMTCELLWREAKANAAAARCRKPDAASRPRSGSPPPAVQPTNLRRAHWDWPDRPRTPCSANRSTSRS